MNLANQNAPFEKENVMKQNTMRHTLLGLLAVTLLCVGVSLAQDRGGQGGGGRQRMDPAQMRERMMDAFKQRMGATDEEWGVIEPKLAKVLEAQRDTRGGMGGMMGRGGRGNRGGGDNAGQQQQQQQDQTPVAKAGADLQTTLENEKASPDEIKQKLQAVRDARAKAEKDLTSAQSDLKDVLTQRQEAMLVLAGMLE